MTELVRGRALVPKNRYANPLQAVFAYTLYTPHYAYSERPNIVTLVRYCSFIWPIGI